MSDVFSIVANAYYPIEKALADARAALTDPNQKVINHDGRPLTIPNFDQRGQCLGCGRLVAWQQQQDHGGCPDCIRRALLVRDDVEYEFLGELPQECAA